MTGPGPEVAGDPEVLVEKRGRLGLLTLNRPRAINALTHRMVGIIAQALVMWQDDDEVATVAITGAGERGLCAGGDVISLHRAATAGDVETAAEFWRDEYRMNAMIARYPKPIVAIQDGLVLGGGIGVSAHASHRVVTERSRLGFPEVTIGFVPDVGATWLLSRAPGGAGTRLGLTAEHVGAADAIFVGFADHFLHSSRIPRLLWALEVDVPSAALAILSDHPGPAPLQDESTWVDDVFAHNTVGDIIDALRERGRDYLAQSIQTKSPLALSVTLESLHRARTVDSLEQALTAEFRVSVNALQAPDFTEGIRAQLVDKDRNPRWRPATLSAVTPEQIDGFFAPTQSGELVFDHSVPKEKS